MKNKGFVDFDMWIKKDVSRLLDRDIEVVLHGGTALTFRGLKNFTLDVDMNVPNLEDFKSFRNVLEKLGYRLDMDFMVRGEHLIRYVSSTSDMDVVDLYHPTWNNWTITDKIRRMAKIIDYPHIAVVLPPPDALFLFKCYPLRVQDIGDLITTIDSGISEENVLGIYTEQEAMMHEREEDENFDHMRSIIEARIRFYLSLYLVTKSGRKSKVGKLYQNAVKLVADINIKGKEGEVISMIRTNPVMWMRFLEITRNKIDKL